MEAKKLRIGNLVHWVSENDDNELENYLCKVDGADLHQMHGNPEYADGHKEIQLTEEWVRKFGFDDSEYKNGYIGIDLKSEKGMITDFVLTKPNVMGDWQTSFAFNLRSNRFVSLNYVHELQNLFFALTGSELQLKQE